jgi:hypothetical protein
MLEWATIAGRVTTDQRGMVQQSGREMSGSMRTQHAQKMFSAINRTHLLLLTHDDVGSRHILFPDFRVLRAFKAIKQVGSQRAIEVDLQAGYNRWKDEFVFFKAAFT